jgi:transposase
MLKKQLANIDSRLAKMLQADTENKRKIEILESVKGVAPINRDSGQKSGKRFIGGGRTQVRRVLYMATIVAIRHNPAIKAFYQRLKGLGKESKVAIVACMRKFITLLNFLAKTGRKK